MKKVRKKRITPALKGEVINDLKRVDFSQHGVVLANEKLFADHLHVKK